MASSGSVVSKEARRGPFGRVVMAFDPHVVACAGRIPGVPLPCDRSPRPVRPSPGTLLPAVLAIVLAVLATPPVVPARLLVAPAMVVLRSATPLVVLATVLVIPAMFFVVPASLFVVPALLLLTIRMADTVPGQHPVFTKPQDIRTGQEPDKRTYGHDTKRSASCLLTDRILVLHK